MRPTSRRRRHSLTSLVRRSVLHRAKATRVSVPPSGRAFAVDPPFPFRVKRAGFDCPTYVRSTPIIRRVRQPAATSQSGHERKTRFAIALPNSSEGIHDLVSSERRRRFALGLDSGRHTLASPICGKRRCSSETMR